MADHLQQLLDLLDKPRMINRLCQLDVTEVARTLGHILIAGSTFELPVDGSKPRIVESLVPRLRLTLVHGLGIKDVANTHILNFFRR